VLVFQRSEAMNTPIAVEFLQEYLSQDMLKLLRESYGITEAAAPAAAQVS
jgi:hypothetical protein